MSQMPDIDVRFTTLEDKHSIALSGRQRDEILLSTPGLPPFTTQIPVFLLLLRAGEAIACGGLRPLDVDGNNSSAEIKRVYVIPEARGRSYGISDFLLKLLEEHALSQGWKTIRLQTGINMVSANRFYERHGYQLIPNYGEYVGSEETISYEKILQ